MKRVLHAPLKAKDGEKSLEEKDGLGNDDLESLASDTKAFQEGDHLGNTFEHDGVVFMTGRLEEVMADNNSTRYVPALKVEGRAYGFHRFRYSSTTEVSTQLAREINIGMHIKNIDPSDGHATTGSLFFQAGTATGSGCGDRTLTRSLDCRELSYRSAADQSVQRGREQAARRKTAGKRIPTGHPDRAV